MSVYKTRIAQTLTLFIYSLLLNQKIALICSLIITILPLRLQLLVTPLAIISILCSDWHIIWVNIIIIALLTGTHLLMHGPPWRQMGRKIKVQYCFCSKYLIFMYLLVFSFISLTSNTWAHDTALIFLSIMLFTYSLNSISLLYKIIIVFNSVATIWALLILLVLKSQVYQESNWFYLVICLSNFMGNALYYLIRHQIRLQRGQIREKKEDYQHPYSQKVHIEMHEINRGTEYQKGLNGQRQFIRKPYRPRAQQNQDQREIKSAGGIIQSPHINFLSTQKLRKRTSDERHDSRRKKRHNKGNQFFSFSDELTQVTWSEHEGQAEVLNIFLLIPFTLFSPSYLQIPIYCYLLLLQYDKTPLWAFYFMFASVCFITIKERNTSSVAFSILLRMCLIAMVNKNFEAGIKFTHMIHKIWMRSSFILVLLVFFWFSLLTVNVLHISFVLIVLLFVVKGNSHRPGIYSFRHRNWKYLVLLFDLFLIMRFIWQIITESGLQVHPSILNIVNILGINYAYNTNPQYFNLVPLLVSATITVQLWTYTSRIYQIHNSNKLDQSSFYRAWGKKILRIFTIVYYKLIPWVSHLVVLFILIKLQFSIIAGILILWSLIVLWVHMVKPNALPAYRSLQSLWMVFLRLIAFQIILRYLFEFLKFPFIFAHLENLPIVNTLLHYQQILGLAIRQSSNSYLSNIFTKFQLMMALDFCIIAISFMTIEYYDILVQYLQVENRKGELDEKANSQQNAYYIYHNYINFKLTEWLANFNEILVNFARAYLWVYYPILGTFSCIYFSYGTFLYFTICVLYYLRVNQKHYQADVLTHIQIRIMSLFQKWRVFNKIRLNLTAPHQPHSEEGIQMQEIGHINKVNKDDSKVNKEDSKVIKDDGQQQVIRMEIQSLENKVNYENPKYIFENIIQLHEKFRFWLMIFTMLFITLTYASRLLWHSEVADFLHQSTISTLKYYLLLMGTSKMSPIGIAPYLIFIGMTIIEIKCCSLVAKNIDNFIKQQKKKVSDNDSPSQSEQYVQHKDEKVDQQQNIVEDNLVLQKDKNTNSQQLLKNTEWKNRVRWNSQSPIDKLNYQQQQESGKKMIRASVLSDETDEGREGKKFVDMEISLRLGMNKILQRFFVILLVFVSILEDNNPFSITYLFCAWLLNYLGNNSVRGLSWVLSFLVMIQYSMIVTDTNNIYEHDLQNYPRHRCWIIVVLGVTDQKWIQYLTFGDSAYELGVLFLSFLILMTYQICFYLEEHNWSRIILRMQVGAKLGHIQSRIYSHFSRIYQYALVYSPLCITTLCLGLYLMDFTATNMFLSLLSIVFLFKSFLLENYTNSRPFWKSYFRILQLLIVIFMVIYCILTTPMYNKYCNSILCSSQQFRTKVTKTILLLILQVGIDLISSEHFTNAMRNLKDTLDQTSSLYKLAIAYVQNDRKISREFKSINRKKNTAKSLQEVKNFLQKLKKDPSNTFPNDQHAKVTSQSWLDTVLELLPSLIDSQLIMTPRQAQKFIKQQNQRFIEWLQLRKENQKEDKVDYKNINEYYFYQFDQILDQKQVKDKIQEILGVKMEEKHMRDKREEKMFAKKFRRHPTEEIDFERFKKERKLSIDFLTESGRMARKSYIEDILPFENNQSRMIEDSLARISNLKANDEQEVQEEIRRSGRMSRNSMIEGNSRKTVQESLSKVDKQEKKKLLYLLIFESILSNWHYLTYTLMVLEFIINMGVLTLPFPFITFALGIVSPYQATKTVWRLAFLALLPPLFVKFSLSIGLVELEPIVEYVLIGSHAGSITIQYLLIFFIIVQCLILKIVGLYDESTADVECMRIALLRNIINCSNSCKQTEEEQREALFILLEKSSEMSRDSLQYWFSKRQCKSGYDYSTLMVTVQLAILIYIFCFYDQMAVRHQLTFYKMIEYNQFTTGMVILAFIQLAFILLDRIMAVVEFSSQKWEITLIFKYCILITSLIFVHVLVMVFFPLNSGHFASNAYVTFFYFMHILYFLISSLQVKFGVDKESRGFMDRYTWYNGFIYMFYRAVPFLFEFKIFSDWTFTTTSLRLFDWLKFQQIYGYLYVAKCNSLFMRGKILGSKIEWWKKLLMGFPLLLAIILLLFGPLILFSSLNPLASFNQVSGGYLQLSLKVNRTNQYPFYINTHITDIQFFKQKPDQKLQQIIKNYEIDMKSIQIVHLEPYSDQYWEISQGSYEKLIQQPEDSLYQLTMRIKFQRNYTGVTPVYTLNSYVIPEKRVPHFKETLRGNTTFNIPNFFPTFIRLDNNNGLHFLSQQNIGIDFHAETGKRTAKKYWVIDGGIYFKVASDKYSKAIFGYSVMSFYISIILVVANYFRFLFQGSAYNIILSDIPYADPLLAICDGIAEVRIKGDTFKQQMLFWMLIDIMRSPDTVKALTGDYLSARLETLRQKDD